MLCVGDLHPLPSSCPLHRACLTNLLALIIFLVWSATSAQADSNWVTVTEYHGVTYYLDVANIVKADGRLRANLLSNYPFEQTVSSESYKSEIEYYSIDCAQKGFEFLHLEYYAENFAKGRLTFSNYSNSYGKLNSPSGIPILESFINMACSMPSTNQWEIKATPVVPITKAKKTKHKRKPKRQNEENPF